MARNSPKSLSTNVGDKSTKREMQARFVEEMAERVRGLAEAQNFNASTLGKSLGIPPSSAANYWSGNRAWPVEVLPDLAIQLSTNVEFLMGGEAKGKSETSARSVREARSSFSAHEARDADTVDIAEIDLSYGLGATYLTGHVEVQSRPFSRSWLRQFTNASPDDLFWSRGQGNSMSPTIDDGEVVLIDRGQVSPSMGDLIWVFAYGDVGMIKRLRPMPDGSVKMLSDNPNVPPEKAVDGELHIIGRVVAIVKRV